MKRLQHSFGRRVISFLLAVSCLCSAVAPGTVYALEEENSVLQTREKLNDLEGENPPDGQSNEGGQETPDGQGTGDGQETPDGHDTVDGPESPEDQDQEGKSVPSADSLSLVESDAYSYWVMGDERGLDFSFAWSGDTAETIELNVTFPAGMVLSLGEEGENPQWTLETDTVKYNGTEVATLTATEGVTLVMEQADCAYVPAASPDEGNAALATLKLTFTCTPSEAGETTGDTQEDPTAGVQLLDNTSSTITFQFKAGVLNSDGCTLQKNSENYDYGTLGFTATAGESTSVSQNLRVVPVANTAQVVDQQGTAQYVVGYLDHQGKAIARQQTAPAFKLTYTVTEDNVPVTDIPEALQQAVLAAFGEDVTALPTPTVTSDTSTYTAKAENLPTEIWLADGQGGGKTYTIDWNINQTDTDYGEKYKGYTSDALAQDGITTSLLADYYYVQTKQQGYEPSKSVTIDSYATLGHKVYWADNNNEVKARPERLGALYELQFALDGSSDYKTLTEGDLAALGMTAVPALTGNIATTYEMALAAPANTLPASITYTYYDTEGEATAPETHTVSWRLVMKDTANYQRVEVTEENKDQYTSVQGKLGTYYVLLFTYEFTLQLRRGGTVLGAGLREAFLQGFDLNIDYGTGAMQRTLDELNEEGSVTLDYDQTNAHPDTVHVSIANGWRYNLDNRLITYVVKQNGDSGEPGKLHPKATAGAENAIPEGDWFAVSYDNSVVPNHGTATDGVYSGGTLYLTLAGETQYKATKIWLDETPNTRPENVEVELWRYTQRNDRNYNNAAPVRDEGGSILKIELEGRSLAESEYKEDIVFTDNSTGNPITLPKYDPEGYLYIYGAREYLTGNYEQIFGEPDCSIDLQTPALNVTFTDTLPEGVSSRVSGDTFVYNKGTLCNRIVGSTTMSVTKRWKAAAFQSEFEGVEVAFALQAKLKDAGNEAYQTTDNTLSMGDFYAENLTYTDSMTVSKYDDLGRELTYRWIEQGVKQNDTEVPSETTGDGKRTFTLEQAGRQVEYTSKVDTENSDSTHTTIVNEISNVIEYAVEKRWEQGTTPKEVSFTLFRTVNGSDFESYLTFTMAPNGAGVEVEITGNNPNNVIVSGVQSETPTGDDVARWKAVLENILEFDEDGNQYEYILLENSGAGYSATSITTERDAITGNYSSVVVNGPGDSNVILVTKQWIDESDVQHRLPVTVTVYERGTNEYVAQATLGDDGNWYALVGIGKNKPEDVYVLETEVGGTEINQTITQPTEYAEGTSDYTRVQYSTDHHKYEATYTSEEILGHTAYNVINRRLGQIDVTVNVTWKDGDGTARQTLADALEAAGFSFALQLDFDDSAQVDEHSEYEITNKWPGGEDTVTLTGVGGEVPIKDEDGNPASSVQTLDLNAATQTIKFCGLPKYNATGGAVRYTVAPVFAYNNSNATYTLAELKEYVAELTNPEEQAKLQSVLEAYAEYVETYGKWTYTVGDKHAEDKQEVGITYRLSDTIDLTWYCRWKDAYVYENGERPDLYLDIYREANGTLEPHVINYRWTYEEPEGSSSPLVNEKTFWQATIANMPKYNSEGYEYTYYAIERTDVVAADFSYLPAKYGQGRDSTASNVFGSRTEAPTAHQDLVCEVQTGETTEYALKAGNTFINTISGDITVEGRKYWQDLPEGYLADDLPGVTFTLTGTSTYKPGAGSGAMQPEPITATLTITKDQWAEMKNGVYQLKLAYVGENKLVIEANGTVRAAYAGTGTATPLPRFDPEGYLYEYEITGEDMLFENQAITDDSWVYDVETSGFLTKGEVYNRYNPQTGSLTAVKYLKIQKDLEAYPSVVLKLTRTYTTNAGTAKEETVATQVWCAADIQQAAVDASGTGEVIVSHAFAFEDLPKYAPNGSEYIYTITEDNTYLGGYASAAYNTATAPGDDEREAAFAELATAGTQGELSVGSLTPHDDSVTGYDATFLNVRKTTQEEVSLTIQKQWNDWDDVFGVRPDEIQITIYRYTDAPPASYQGQKIDPEPLTGYENYLWNSADNEANLWQLTIPDLERYAPNGMPWKYKVEEKSTDQYYTVTGNNAVSGTPDANGNVAISGLTNSMQTSALFKKQWVDSQGNPITADSLGGLQLRVDFKLQVCEGGTGIWQDAETYFERALGQQDYDKVFGTYNFTQTLTDVLSSNVWTKAYSFANLPRAIKKSDSTATALTELSYRVVESEIRVYAADADPSTATPLMKQTVTVTDDANGNSYTYEFSNGLFSPYYGSETATSHTNTETTHWNQLKTTDLTVTKTWADDHSNIYGTRPKGNATGNKTWAVTFAIQRSTDGGTTWTNVKDANGNDRTVTLMGIDNDVPVQGTVTGLPRSILDEEGNVVPCTYRARELDDDGDLIETSGTSVYQNVYTVEYDEDAPGAVTNRLRTTQFTAEKKWIIDDNSSRPNITLELQYLASDGKTWKSFDTPAKVVLDGEADKNPAKPYYENSTNDKWTAIWDDVPLVLPGSKLDESGHTQYKVVETAVSGYVTTYKTEGANTVITNTKLVNIDVDVTKIWVDADNAMGDRPASVTFVLYADGKATTHELTLTAPTGLAGLWNRLTGQSDTWTGRFTGLPKYDSTDGHEIKYTVQEKNVPEGYVAMVGPDGLAVTNTRTGNLLVEKVVTGSDGETHRTFHFTVELSDKTVNGVHGGVTFTDGVASFGLKSGDQVLIENLPAGCTYTITEEEANTDGYTTVSQGAAGKIEAGLTVEAQIENHRDAVPQATPTPTPGPEGETTGTSGGIRLPATGDDANLTALYVLLGLSAAGLIALAGYGMYRRKKGR